MSRQSHGDNEVFTYLREWIEAYGEPPSVRQLASAFGYTSPSAIHRRLVRLRSAGRIDWEPNIARSIRIVGGAE